MDLTSAGNTGNLAHTVTVEGMATAYISQSDIARTLGISRPLMSKWLRQPSFPNLNPDGVIGNAPLYRAERLNEIVSTIRAWESTRPGQGAGGGRPRKHPLPGANQ